MAVPSMAGFVAFLPSRISSPMRDTHLNITTELDTQARLRPDHPAIFYEGRQFTHGELAHLSRRSAQFFAECGVRPADVVALNFQNMLALALAILGLTRLGSTLLVIPRSTTPSQRAEWTRLAQARVRVGDTAQAPGQEPPDIVFDTSRLAIAQTRPPPNPTPSMPWMVVLGSGSTGRRKLIPITHDQLRQRIYGSASIIFDRSDRALILTSLEYPTTIIRLFDVLRQGATLHLTVPNGQPVPAYCDQAGITVLVATVFHVEQMLTKTSESARLQMGRIRALRVAGSTVTPNLRGRIRQHLTENLFVGYGTNECGSITRAGPPAVFAVEGTVGQAGRGVALEIVDEQDRPMPPGAVGRIRVRTPGMVGAYLNDPVATRQAWRDGWFYPGDLGRLSTLGELIHCGRADQMMIFNGINMYPAEIEQCLTGHPDVTDAAAFAIPDPVHQDIPMCVVSLERGSRTTEAQLLAYARERLGFRSPQRVFAMVTIPRNEQGKPLRARIAELVVRRLSQLRPPRLPSR